MAMKVDAFEEFSERLSDFSEHSDEVLYCILLEILHRTLRLVIKSTPVGVYPNKKDKKDKKGKKGGTLKKSWGVRLRDVTLGAGVVAGEIVNTAPYAPYVEFGHRIVTRDGTTIGWKEGKFMLTVSLQTVEKYIDEIAAREVQKALGSVFR